MSKRTITVNGELSYHRREYFVDANLAGERVLVQESPERGSLLVYKDEPESSMTPIAEVVLKHAPVSHRLKVTKDNSITFKGATYQVDPELGLAGNHVFVVEDEATNHVDVYPTRNLRQKLCSLESGGVPVEKPVGLLVSATGQVSLKVGGRFKPVYISQKLAGQRVAVVENVAEGIYEVRAVDGDESVLKRVPVESCEKKDQ
jgi:hypothetical protein